MCSCGNIHNFWHVVARIVCHIIPNRLPITTYIICIIMARGDKKINNAIYFIHFEQINDKISKLYPEKTGGGGISPSSSFCFGRAVLAPDKSMKHLSRAELLEMLLAQMEENRRLKRRLHKANELLQNRQICIEQSGSLAEAALRLNGIFEAADRAAQQYLENVQGLAQDKAESSDAARNASPQAAPNEQQDKQ